MSEYDRGGRQTGRQAGRAGRQAGRQAGKTNGLTGEAREEEVELLVVKRLEQRPGHALVEAAEEAPELGADALQQAVPHHERHVLPLLVDDKAKRGDG